MQSCAGANLEVDIPVRYLRFFLDDDDEELARIEREYGAGRMMTGEVKAALISVRTRAIFRNPPVGPRPAMPARGLPDPSILLGICLMVRGA